MTYLEETENYILSTVRNALLDVGNKIDHRMFVETLSRQPPHIKANLTAAFNSLVDQGLFDKNECLTEAGYNCVYSITSQTQKVNEAKTYILSTVRNALLDVGNKINPQIFVGTLFHQPPHIQNNLDDAFHSLVEQGLFDEEGSLTQQGYDKLYS